MSGIAGLFHCGTIKPVDPARVERMADVLSHRGSDGSGIWTAPGVGLGHRRLATIDLEGSPQPMMSASQRLVISFDGAIYNFRDLRRELEARGHEFRTSGDTEVILTAYEQWGADCVTRLNGMFAFAIYDQKRRELFLARDRMGVKPLFLAEFSDGSVGFASELKGLLAHPLMRREVDLRAVEDFMAWGYVPDHRSILKGVRKLPAGHTLLLKHDSPTPASQQYWDVSFANRRKGKPRDLEAELLHHMQEAVTSHMVSDVPVGAFLLGGSDSSSVVAFMAEASRRPVKTSSIGFDVGSASEASHAETVASLFGTDHSARTIKADQFDGIDAIAGMFDEPFADPSALPSWRVSQLARESMTVALSGEGADEAMAGYRRQVSHMHEERLRGLIPQGLRRNVIGPLGRIYPRDEWAPGPLRARTTLLSLAGSAEQAYARALAVMSPEDRFALYSPALTGELGGYRAEDALLEVMAKASMQTGLDQAQYADLKFWLPGNILTRVDRTSMAASVEAREPLLDHRLVEFAASLPDGLRVRGRQGKWLMKKAMQRYLPDDILYRTGEGLETPIAGWLRGPLAGKARGIGKSAMLARTGWFDNARISQMAEDHIAGRADHARLLWQLVMLDRSLARLGIT